MMFDVRAGRHGQRPVGREVGHVGLVLPEQHLDDV
jgi:hypothetical protein